MKKYITVFMMSAILAIMVPAFSSTALAQTRNYRTTSRSSVASRNRNTYAYKKPSLYRRHRNMFNIAIGTGAGALIGGLLGGRRGAGLGMLAGAGSGALYTYKLNPKRRNY